MALSTFADGALFGRRHGQSPPRVLALHGWQRDHHDWAAVLEGLDAIAVDLPGFGATPPPPEPWGSRAYADAVAPILGEMAPPIVVAGHSFGGRVAMQLAALHPDEVGAIVLTGVPNLWPLSGSSRARPALTYRIVRWLHQRGVVADERMERLRQRHGSADYRSASGVMRDVLVTVVNERYDEVLGSLECPIELVWGTGDTAAPLGGAEAVAAEVDGARLIVVEGGGHFLLDTAPHELEAAIRRRLGELP